VRPRRIAWILCLCIATGPAVSIGDDGSGKKKKKEADPWIEVQHAQLEDGRVRVDFNVEGVFTEETLEWIHSGIAVKFRHRIEVIGPRRFLLSRRNVLARSVVETRVSYDALTARYELSRVTTLKKPQRKDGPPPYEEASVTDDVEQMYRWMVEGQHVVLYDPKNDLSGDDLRVAIESSIGRDYVLWIFPTSRTVDTISPVSR
jgi:hypothetical protein